MRKEMARANALHQHLYCQRWHVPYVYIDPFLLLVIHPSPNIGGTSHRQEANSIHRLPGTDYGYTTLTFTVSSPTYTVGIRSIADGAGSQTSYWIGQNAEGVLEKDQLVMVLKAEYPVWVLVRANSGADIGCPRQGSTNGRGIIYVMTVNELYM